MARPTVADSKEAERLLMWAIAHSKYELVFGGPACTLELLASNLVIPPGSGKSYGMYLATDADFPPAVGMPEDAKTICATVIMWGGAGLDVNASRAHTIVLDTAAAETIGLSRGIVSLIPLQGLAQELGVPFDGTPLPAFCDNESTTAFALNATSIKRAAYILRRIWFVRQAIEAGYVNVIHLSGSNMVADVLTKYLHGPIFWKHMIILMGGLPPDMKTPPEA